MMDDLIRREDALNALNLVDAPFLPMNTNEHIAYVYALKNLPSVDAVEVLRCKDCKHWKHGNIRPNYCEVFEWNNEKSDFCSFGERKTDG